MRTIQDIKLIPIRDYLVKRGIAPRQENSRYGFYLSPLRDEQDASFKVDYVQNLWYDFARGVAAQSLTLLWRSRSATFSRQWSDCETTIFQLQLLLLRKLYTLYRIGCKY